jgi:hypothetical protein
MEINRDRRSTGCKRRTRRSRANNDRPVVELMAEFMKSVVAKIHYVGWNEKGYYALEKHTE